MLESDNLQNNNTSSIINIVVTLLTYEYVNKM